MVIKPDYKNLIKKINNKYLLCLTAAKRAEQLVENDVAMRAGKSPKYEGALVDEFSPSYLYIALREIEEGYVAPHFPEEEPVERFDIIKHVEEKTFEFEPAPRKVAQKALDEVEQILEDVTNQVFLMESEKKLEEEASEVGSEDVGIIEKDSDDVSLEELQEIEARKEYEEEVEEESL